MISFEEGLAALLILASTGCADELVRLQAEQIPERAATGAPHVTATWMGTAGVMFDDGTTALLVDPFVSRPSLGRVAFGRPVPVDEARIDLWMKMPGIDRTAAVFVSHSHYDHSMDAPSFAKRTGARLVGSESTAIIGERSGLPSERIDVVQPGTPMRFGDFTVTMLHSQHGKAVAGRVPYPGNVESDFETPAKAKDYRMGGAYAIVVEHPTGTAVHHASAGWAPRMYEGIDADVVFLGLAGRDDTAKYLDAVLDATGARRVVPIHWDNFFRGFDEALAPLGSARVNEFLDHLADTRPDLTVQTLPLGHARPVLGG